MRRNRHHGNPIKSDDGSDSDDLQALFDSIAAGAPRSAAASASGTRIRPATRTICRRLFDSVAADAASELLRQPQCGAADDPQEVVFNRLGHLARQLHDSLRELGVDKRARGYRREADSGCPRASDLHRADDRAGRLQVLNATDIAKPVQDDLHRAIQGLVRPLGQNVRQPVVGGRIQDTGGRHAQLLSLKRRPG